jgi:ribonucleoside-diphosphate reductase beta chain
VLCDEIPRCAFIEGHDFEETMMTVAETPRVFSTTSTRRLNQNLLPMRLWHKAKKLGTWDPMEIDFSQDKKDWDALNDLERTYLLQLAALYQAGEESVTLDLLPLIMTVARDGRLEEEMFLTSFLWEEAKHVETFQRFITEVAGSSAEDLAHFHVPSYRTIFYDELPTSLNRLLTDSSPVALAEASVTYNMIVEGVMAETGYYAYHLVLERHGIMPGMQKAMMLFKRDESRHIAYGVYLLSRLVAEHGDPVWEAIENRMNTLLLPAIATINEFWDQTLSRGPMPFGLQLEEIIDFAFNQFQKRMNRIERARGMAMDQLNGSESEALEREEVVA